MILGAKEYYTGQAQWVKGLRSPSKDIVEIELKNPFPPILYILAGGTAKILPFGYEDFHSPIGTGPFQFVSVDKKDLILKQFKNYHSKKNPYFKNDFKTYGSKIFYGRSKIGKNT